MGSENGRGGPAEELAPKALVLSRSFLRIVLHTRRHLPRGYRIGLRGM